jgi:hypothetical protein
LPISLPLNQFEMSKESCDKLVLNKRIYQLEKYIKQLEYIVDTAPSVSFNPEHLFVPRKIACLFMGEVSLQYHLSDNFLNNPAINPTIIERLSSSVVSASSGYYFCGADRFPKETNSYYTTTYGGGFRQNGYGSAHSSISPVNNPQWDLAKLNLLVNLKYLAIDCLAIKKFDIEYIPNTVEYLYLIDPQFTTLPDFRNLTNLKKMVIEGRSKSLLKEGMEQVRIFKMKQPDFVFEKTGDQKEIIS